MLLLSRKRGEKIVIPNEGIEVVVLEVRSDRIRLGINAPDAVTIRREEVLLRAGDRPPAERQ